MSVDLGLSRTGIAACDPLEMLASPVKVIFEKYEPKLIEEVVKSAKELSAELIIVGLPLNMDGISPFRKRVWELMLTIPYGKTLTYGQIAKQIEKETGRRVSAQAVGGAVGHN